MRNLICCDCQTECKVQRKRLCSDGYYRCKKCSHNRRNRKYEKTEKGKRMKERFYQKHGYIHQNKPFILKKNLLERYPNCQLCGTTENLSVDHMHPQKFGGTNDDFNLWVLCVSCNSFKGTRLMTPGGAILNV